MPIHEQGYRRYAGERALRRGWWVIARAHLRTEIQKRQVKALLLFAWTPFLVRAVLIYASVNFNQVTALATTPDVFRQFLDWQNVFVFFVTILIGAPLIADDRRANALQIYLSKPLTRVEYVAGKLTALAIFLFSVTFLPAILLVVLQVVFSGSVQFVRDNLFILPAITLFSLLQIFISSFAVLALSSLSNSRRFVAMMYAGTIFFTSAMNQALGRITTSRVWAVISPNDTLDVVADAMFRVPGPRAIPLPAAIAAVVVLIIACLIVLERRVRAVEAVS